MNYVVELHKSPTTLVRELFNFHNKSNYSETELWPEGPLEVLKDGPYNTKQRMAVDDPSLGPMLSWAMISYNRIDLATLFSVVEVKLREVDIKADGSYDHDLVLGEVSRKYGLNVDEGQFVIKTVEGKDHLVATNDNLAFIGNSPLVVELSLDSRVDLKVLNGFYALLGPFGPGGKDITFGDMDLGFITDVPSNSLISGTGLAHLIGLEKGNPLYDNNDTDWVKYVIDERVCFTPRLPLRSGVSYQDLADVGATGDGKVIVIGEDVYRVRLLQGIGDPDGAFERPGFDSPATHGSEWNRVMYRLAKSGVVASEEPFEPWMSLTNDELGLTGNYAITEGTVNDHDYPAIQRGYNDVGFCASNALTHAHANIVWRPVLEVVKRDTIFMGGMITKIVPRFIFGPSRFNAGMTATDLTLLSSVYDTRVIQDMLKPVSLNNDLDRSGEIDTVLLPLNTSHAVKQVSGMLSMDHEMLLYLADIAHSVDFLRGQSLSVDIEDSEPYISAIEESNKGSALREVGVVSTEVYVGDEPAQVFNPQYQVYRPTLRVEELSVTLEGGSNEPPFPIPPSEGPGDSEVIGTDPTVNDDLYYGTIPYDEFITDIELNAMVGADRFGKYTTPVQGANVWHKFKLDGKIALVPQANFRTSISWNQLNSLGLVDGVTVEVDGATYLVRLMNGTGILHTELPSSIDTGYIRISLESLSEWDRTIGRISSAGTGKWGSLSANQVIGGNFSPWCMESSYTSPTKAIIRSSSAAPVTAVSGRDKGDTATYRSFRPILILQE